MKSVLPQARHAHCLQWKACSHKPVIVGKPICVPCPRMKIWFVGSDEIAGVLKTVTHVNCLVDIANGILSNVLREIDLKSLFIGIAQLWANNPLKWQYDRKKSFNPIFILLWTTEWGKIAFKELKQTPTWSKPPYLTSAGIVRTWKFWRRSCTRCNCIGKLSL